MVDDGKGRDLLVLYDSGALTSGIKESVVRRLGSRVLRKGPIPLTVVGGGTCLSQGGVESFTLPLADGRIVTISALVMKEVTGKVASYNMTSALSDLEAENSRRGNGSKLPQVDEVVGGRSIDLLLGAEYSYLFPQASPVISLPSGLSIGRAKLLSASGKQGVIWGVHGSWDHLGPSANSAFLVREELKSTLPHLADGQPLFSHSPVEFFESLCAKNENEEDEEEMSQLREELKGECADVLADATNGECADSCKSCRHWNSPETLAAVYSTHFGSDEALTAAQTSALADAAVAVDYRCPSCRSCNACRDGDGLEMRSLNEEREQLLIQKSVSFDPGEGKLTATLPFIKEPSENLSNNQKIAEKILLRNWKKLAKKPKEKKEVIDSFMKLYGRQYIQKVDDLSDDEKAQMNSSMIPSGGYIIPWQVVVKANSLSTPVRIVMNAASKTPAAASLNDILAKGVNTIVSLFSTLVNFRLGGAALSADIAKFYNQTRLDPSFLQYQQLLWPEDWLAEGGEGGGGGAETLNPTVETLNPTRMVVKTLIYGLRPSGQQCAVGVRELAKYAEEQRPELAAGAAAVKAAYVDDVVVSTVPGTQTSLAHQIQQVLAYGGMEVKGFAISGEEPPAELSADGETVGVLGYVWNTKCDLLSLESKVVDLICSKGKQINPRPSLDLQFENPLLFTKRNILSLSLRLFDPLGLFSPVYGPLKLAVQEVVTNTDGWDTTVDANYKPVFRSLIEMLTQLPPIRLPRAAVRGEGGIELVCFCDASQSLMCAAVYARTVDARGDVSIHLICAKQKLSNGSSIPRSELKALVIGASLCHTIRKRCDKVESVKILTDSAIALLWALSDHRPLTSNIRNSVLEIRRLTDMASLYHVRSSFNLADIGTKPAALEDVDPKSIWFSGHPWMKEQPEEWPVTPASDLSVSDRDRAEVGREMKSSFASTILTISGRKSGNNGDEGLLVDPVYLGWQRAVNIMSKVISFVKKKCKEKYKGPASAMDYFAKKSSQWVESQRSAKELERAGGVKEGGVWLYNARLLSTGHGKIEGIEAQCLDVKPDMFRTPLALADSKIGLSVMTYCHQLNGHHRGVTATYVESLSVFHILGGRKLAGTVRSACPRCIFSQRRKLTQHLGPLHASRTLIAPAFTWPAIDIVGPFKVKCACGSNHRAAAKGWVLVLRCPSTNAVSAEVMETLSTASAADAYSRHASRYGHAQYLTSDQGTQLRSLWKNGKFSYVDLTLRLQSEFQQGGIRTTIVPAGDHSANGVAERAIGTIREMLGEMFTGRTFSILQLQTFVYFVCNTINGIPFALHKASVSNLDPAIICPNQLLLGHANRRALAAPVRAGNLNEHVQFIDEMEKAFHQTWSKTRLDLFVNDRRAEDKIVTPVNKGDIVIFPKLSTELKPGTSPLRIARVRSVVEGSNGRVRALLLEYKTKPSKNYSVTERAPDEVTVVTRVENIDTYANAEPPASSVDDSPPAPPDIEDEFEREASSAVYWGAQMVALTRE